MSDDDSFDDIMEQIQCQQEAQRQQARQTLAATCDRLTVLGVTQVNIAYDGYGDSGAISSIFACQGEQEVSLSAEITNALDEAACELLPAGWEISDGSFGELVLDVAGRKLTREHNWRITETEYEEEDFQL